MILADERYVRMASRSIFTAMSRVDEWSTVMSQVYVSMAMSLDGFVTGPQDDAENPAGINGMRLMDWLGTGEGEGVEAFRPIDPNSQIVVDEMLATGAVITGKRTGDFAGYWGGDHHNGVPIFVPHPSATG